MERPASRASRYCVIPRSSRAVTRIFPNGHGEDFLLIFFQAHQPIHFVQQVTGRNAKPRPRRMIIRALGSRLEFSSLFRYSSAIPVLLASWYCDIWRDSRILTSAAPNRHCFTFPILSFYREWEISFTSPIELVNTEFL